MCDENMPDFSSKLLPAVGRTLTSYGCFAYVARQSQIINESLWPKVYKGRSQEKTLLRRPQFFLLRSPPDRARSVLTYRSMCPVAGQYRPAVGVFSTSGFHRFFATKPVSSETSKAERWSNLA